MVPMIARAKDGLYIQTSLSSAIVNVGIVVCPECLFKYKRIPLWRSREHENLLVVKFQGQSYLPSPDSYIRRGAQWQGLLASSSARIR